MADQPTAEHNYEAAVRFLALIKKLDPPGFGDMIRASLVLRDSQDLEAVRLAGKAMLRNLERLEDKLDDAKYEVEKLTEKNAQLLNGGA